MNKTAKTILWLVVGIIILGGIWYGVSRKPTAPTTKETIKIGFIGPLSGGPSLWGQGSLDMINMAVEEINNQGGINGRKLVVIPEDGKCQPEAAVTAIQKLINVDKVKFILGGHCSPETAAIAPIAENNKVFMLAGVSTASGILDKYSYAFRTSPPNWEQACLIGKIALKKYNLKKIAVLNASTAFTKSISNDFVNCFKEQGGEIVKLEEYTWPETSDFKTFLLKIKDSKPDAIFVATQGVEGVQILKQMNELGIKAVLTGNTVFIHKKTYAESGGLLPSNAFTVAPYVDVSNKKASEVIAKYKAKYGKDVPYNLFFVGAAYDGVYMLKEALEKCGEDPVCVRDYFFKIKNWEGATAVFSFNKKGDPVLKVWKELRIVNGEEVFEPISE
jgi:branched-chain amino acid transport system substrate-binding protein